MSTSTLAVVRHLVWVCAILALWGTAQAQKVWHPDALARVEVSFQEGVDGYTGARDAKLLSESPNVNFGSDPSHVADGDPDKATLLYWDLSGAISPGSTVQSAEITLKVHNDTGDIYELFGVHQDWVADEVTWLSYRNGQAWAIPGANGAADRDTQPLGELGPATIGTKTITLNATGLAVVQQWINNPSGNYGVILLNYNKATDGIEFHAAEAETIENRPRLTVVYEPGGGGGNGPSGTALYRASWRDNPATTMTIGWTQTAGANPVLCYGTTDHGRNLTDPANSCAPYTGSRGVDQTYTHKGMDNRFARLSGLTQNTVYYFVIRDSQGISERMSFKTAPTDPNARFSFIAGGDSRENSLVAEPVGDPHRQVRRKANRMVGKLRPLFVAFNGDFTHTGSAAQVQNWMEDWQQTIRDGRLIPVLPAIGDHEKQSAQFSWLEGVDLQQLFDLPSPDAYYKLTFAGGLLSHFTLNSKISPDDIFGGTQAVWDAQNAWFASALNGDDSYWKIVQIHDPTRAHRVGKGDRDDQYAAWAGLMHQNEVDLVTEADGHLIKQTWPLRPSTDTADPTFEDGFVRDDATGTVYIGEGGWGALLHPCGLPRVWTRACDSFNQFKWIQVHGREKLEVRAVKLDNADAAGTVSDADPLALPSNLDVWTPANGTGAVLTIPLAAAPNNTLPVARLSAVPGGGTVPLNVNFDASASSDADGSIAAYAWNFGDGTTGTGQTTAHTYTTAGSYTATLTVTDNDGGTGSAGVTITALESNNTPPVARIGASATSGNAPLAVNFDASASSDADGSIAAYAWNFGDGTTGTGQTTAHTYTTAGNYTATLTVTDNDGESGSASVTIQVSSPQGNAAPTARIGASATSGEAPLTLNYSGQNSSDSDGSIVQYQWDFGNGTTATGESGTVTYTAAGRFTLALTVIDDDGATDRTQIEITVRSQGNAPPVARFSATPTSGDTPLDVTFNASASSDADGTIAGYAWDFGDGATSTGVTASHRYTLPGTYTVRLTITDNDGATASASTPITGLDPVTAGVATLQHGVGGYLGARDTRIASDAPDEAFGDTEVLDAEGSPGRATLLLWDLGLIPPGSRVHSVELNVLIRNGTNDAYFLYEMKRPWVEPEATWNQYADGMPWQTPGANGPEDRGQTPVGQLNTTGQVIFNDDAVALLQKWVDDPASNHGFIILNPSSADAIEFISREAVTPAHRPRLVVRYEPGAGGQAPVAQFTAVGDPNTPGLVHFDASAAVDPDGSIVSYAWDFGDGNTGTGVTTSHVYAEVQQYAVTLTVTDNDGLTATVSTPVHTANEDEGLPAGYVLRANYPNPFKPSTTIGYTLPQSTDVHLQVYDLMGREVAELVPPTRQAAGQYEVVFNAVDLPSGVYFYRFRAGTVVRTQKMLLME